MLDAATQGQLASTGAHQPAHRADRQPRRQPGAADIRELLTEIAAIAPEKITAHFDGQLCPQAQLPDHPRSATTWACTSPPCRWGMSSRRWCWPALGRRPPAQGRAEDRADPRPWTATTTSPTWMSLTCHNCPDVVQALNLMAALNPRRACGHGRRRLCSRLRSRRATSWPSPEDRARRRRLCLGPHRAERNPPRLTPAPPPGKPPADRKAPTTC